MKNRKKLTFAFFLLIVTTAFIGKNANSEQVIFDLALDNITSIAGPEDGTKVGDCFRRGGDDNVADWRILCDSRTDESTIYPCETGTSYSYYMKADKCTK